MTLSRIALVALAAIASAAAASAQTTLFSDDFESGLGAWSVIHPPGCGAQCSGGVTWRTIDAAADCGTWAYPFPSGDTCARFGHSQHCDFVGDNNAIPTAQLRTTQSIALPVAAAVITLRFWTKSEAEDDGWDLRTVELDHAGLTSPIVLATLTSSNWQELSLDLTPYAGQNVQLIFRFEALDFGQNDGHGWFIDDVRVESSANVPFCFGDGSATACPCGNQGASGHGCASSIEPSGSVLVATGSAQLSADSMTLTATGVSNSVALIFQGTTLHAGGMGTVFGDGLRCAGGTIVRVASRQASGGSVQFPGAGDPPLHVAGQVPPGGGLRTYQVWYRNAAPFCSPSTFNLTNGIWVTWVL